MRCSAYGPISLSYKTEDEREKATTTTNQEVKESIAELKEKVEDMIKSQRPGNIFSILFSIPQGTACSQILGS